MTTLHISYDTDDEAGTALSCDGEATVRIVNDSAENGYPIPGPLSWFNSARITTSPDDDSVAVAISVGDPRGAHTMTIRRLSDGRLVMHVPYPGESLPHTPLEPLHEGTYQIPGDYSDPTETPVAIWLYSRGLAGCYLPDDVYVAAVEWEEGDDESESAADVVDESWQDEDTRDNPTDDDGEPIPDSEPEWSHARQCYRYTTYCDQIVKVERVTDPDIIGEWLDECEDFDR